MSKARERPERTLTIREFCEAENISTGSPLAAVLWCAAHGLPIVQLHEKKNGLCTCGREDCERPGGHPRTEYGLVHPTTDAAVIRKNCTQRPNAAIAVATGEPDLLAVMITRTTARTRRRLMDGARQTAQVG
jgi:hypothetical protein